MKSNTKKIVILLVLGMGFVLLPNTMLDLGDNRKPNVINPKISGGYSESFIHIDGNIPGNWSDTASTYDWCSGDGSWSNPYTIENVTVDCGGSGSGIFIDNSENDYFIIRNCTVYNAGSGTYDAGIKLEITNKGTLTNNNCSNNPQHGILLHNFCDNNTLSGNTACNNSGWGINIDNHSDNNTISGNIANGNDFVGIYLDQSEYSIITGNTANDNNYGINVYLCDYTNITGNTANNNTDRGINIEESCHNNNISLNPSNNNSH